MEAEPRLALPRSRKRTVVGAALAVLLMVVFTLAGFLWFSDSAKAAQTVPYKVNFQGRLANNAGNVMPDGQYNVKFRLFSVASGGTAVWEETRETTNRVTVTNGVFSVQLGDVTALSPSVFTSQPLYFEIELPTPATATCSTASCANFNGTEIMSPRRPLGSSPYAMNADTLDGYDADAFLRLGVTQSGSIDIGSGTITSGNINGQTISSAANFTGTVAVATSVSTPLLQNAGTLNLSATGANVVQLNTNGTLRWSVLSTGELQGNGASTIRSSTGNLTLASNGGNGNVILAPNGTGTIQLNGNTTVAAGNSITLVGGITSTRPASPTAGTLYYDSTTSQLLAYNGTKWQADRSGTTKIVAASNSSQAAKDAADFVGDGDGVGGSDGDQVEINAALTAAAGGKVYLMEGTYVVDQSISVPNNTTLAGAGRGTLIELADLDAARTIMVNTDTTNGTGIIVQDLRIDGRRDLNTGAGIQAAIFLSGMGGGSGTTARQGGKFNNLYINNMKDYAIRAYNTNFTTFANNTFSNSKYGISFEVGGGKNTVTGNVFQYIQSAGSAIYIDNNQQITVTGNSFSENSASIYGWSGAIGAVISGNSFSGDSDSIYGAFDSSVISGNTFSNNASFALYLAGTTKTQISNNRILNSGGTTLNNGIYSAYSTDLTITGNDITDTSCTTTCYAINLSDAASTNNYLADNRIGSPGTINDLGAGTRYANQQDGSGNLLNRSGGGGMSVGKTSTSATLNVQGGLEVDTLPTPASPTLAVVGTTGATTRRYQITALDGLGETLPSTIVQVTNANATLTASNRVDVTWSPVGGAVQYRIYRCTNAACTPALLATVAGNVTSYQDTANGSPSGALPTVNSTGGAQFAGDLRFADADGSNYVAFKAPSVVSSNVTWTLPTADAVGCLQSDGAGTLSIATCGGGGGGGDTNTQTFTASGTYTLPTSALMVIIESWGGGGGGGGGAGGATSAARTGGGGGGGGAYNTTNMQASAIGTSGTTVQVTIGAGGTGGNGGTGAVGANGGAGGQTCFSTAAACGGTMYLQSYGGGGGGAAGAAGNGGGGGGGTQAVGANSTSATGAAGGNPLGAAAGAMNSGSGGGGGATAGAGAVAGGSSNWGGGAGGASTTAGANPSGAGGGSNQGGAGGGGGGSCATTTCTLRAGGAGGRVPGLSGGGGTAGATAGQAGGAGSNGVGSGGDGGGGGANNTGASAIGGAGGAGGARGGGGGGGGGSSGTGTPVGGTGGTGGAGFLRVFTLRGAGADLAEVYCTNDPSIIAGDTVAIDPLLRAGVQKSARAYDPNAIGVISTSPGLTIGYTEEECDKPVIVALAGRVPVAVSLENGPIKPGDSLTASSTPGVAMKATKAGTVIGQALTGYDGTLASPYVVAFVQNHQSNGVSMNELIPGLNNDSDTPISQQALEYMVAMKDLAIDKTYVSEISTDRLTAGLEIITPSVVTDALTTNTIGSSGGGDISFVLNDSNKLVVKGKQGAPGFTVDATGNALFGISLTSLGTIESRGGLTVLGDALFGGKATFARLAEFEADAVFKGRITYSNDSGGLAMIPKGGSRVAVLYDRPFELTPIVSATLIANQTELPDGTVEDVKLKEQRLFNAGYSFLISGSTKDGFTIVLNKPATEDLQFSWTLAAIKDAKTTLGTVDSTDPAVNSESLATQTEGRL